MHQIFPLQKMLYDIEQKMIIIYIYQGQSGSTRICITEAGNIIHKLVFALNYLIY